MDALDVLTYAGMALLAASVIITNSCDTPPTPPPGAPWRTVAWYWTYRGAELVRLVSQRAKQHPEAASDLRDLAQSLARGHVDPVRAAGALENLADRIGPTKPRTDEPPCSPR